MNTSQIGKKILELRQSKGYTQKELADACNIDIRTIQRIEASDVIPRSSTIKLIASVLESDMGDLLNGDNYVYSDKEKSILLFTFVIGIINVITFVFYSGMNFISSFTQIPYVYYTTLIIYVLVGIAFYIGIFYMAGRLGNFVLQIAAIIVTVLIPLFAISDVVLRIWQFNPGMIWYKFLGVLFGLNGILLGIGLILTKSKYKGVFIATGILQIIVSPLFLIPFQTINIVGLILSVPFLIMLVVAVFLEYRLSVNLTS